MVQRRKPIKEQDQETLENQETLELFNKLKQKQGCVTDRELAKILWDCYGC